MPEPVSLSTPPLLDPATVRHVGSTCLCLHAQRAARALARRFDRALAPFGLTNGQFSLLMGLNRQPPATISGLAQFLAMDRTTLTAALKPLEGAGLARITPDPSDRRNRQVTITADGVARLTQALPVWREVHAQIDAGLDQGEPEVLRAGLQKLVRLPPITA